MAKDKKSFLLYCDMLHTVNLLDDNEAGILFKTILNYVNDLNPEIEDKLMCIVFEPIKQQLKRDLKEWETTIHGKSEGGKKSAEIRKKIKDIESKLNIVKDTSSNSTVNVNDNVTVNVNDNVNVRKKGFAPPSKEDVSNYFFDKLDEFTAMAEADKFIAYYESNGWKVGKNKMQSWKGAASGWISRMPDYGKSKLTTEQLRELARQQDEELLKQKQ